jgi:hypothetical protein
VQIAATLAHNLLIAHDFRVDVQRRRRALRAYLLLVAARGRHAVPRRWNRIRFQLQFLRGLFVSFLWRNAATLLKFD